MKDENQYRSAVSTYRQLSKEVEKDKSKYQELISVLSILIFITTEAANNDRIYRKVLKQYKKELDDAKRKYKDYLKKN